MSFLEGDEKEGPGTSQVLGLVPIVPQGPQSSLNCLSTMEAKAGIVTEDTL